MPLAFLIVGVLLILTGVKGDPNALYNLVVADFSWKTPDGKNGYLYWMLAILVLGALGYVKALEKPSRAFMVLVVLVLLLKNEKGFVAQLEKAGFLPTSKGV